MTPGRKFSMTTSTTPMSRRTRSRLSGTSKSTEIRRFPTLSWAKPGGPQRNSLPGLVTPWRLELDHVGAQFGEQASAVGARDDAGQVEDTGPGQGTPTHPHVAAPWAMSRKGAS